MAARLESYVDELRHHPRIESLIQDETGLVVTVGGRAISLLPEVDGSRVAVWCPVRQLTASELAVATAVAADFNRAHFAEAGLVLGLLAERSLLIVGCSVDGANPATAVLCETIADVCAAAAEAQARLQAAGTGALNLADMPSDARMIHP